MATRKQEGWDHNYMVPWAAVEFIYVDDKPYVYTGYLKDNILVRFPGGGADYAGHLETMGHKVVYPEKFRRSY